MDGERQREAIIEAIRSTWCGLDTNELATALDLHPNTVRWHLGLLTDAGLIEGRPERRHDRGRPSIVYRLTGEGVGHDRDDYRLLATMLAGVIADEPDGAARSYRAGVGWGRQLHAAEPGDDVAQLLDKQGFEARRCADRIEMRRCPFAALAGEALEVICPLHRGVIDGALAASGSARAVERLEPFVEPSLCVAHLR